MFTMAEQAPPADAVALANALINAAQNAAQASASVQQFVAQQSSSATGSTSVVGNSQSKYANAGKMVRMPDPFTAQGAEQEQTAWGDFELNLKAWLFAADPKFEKDLEDIESHLEVEYDMDVQPDDAQTRSQELHSIFVGLLRNRSLKTLRAVSGRNGFEVYRQLQKLYKPSTKPRSMALLSALMSLPNFNIKERSLHDHVQGLDRLMAEYQRSCGTPVPDEVSLSVLVRCLPGHIRQHVQLSLDETSTYASVRNRVLGFETVTTGWTASRVHAEFGISANPGPNGPGPMEIDRFESKGKGKHKGKRKTKSKFDSKGKTKGKNQKGKGGHFPDSKGKGKQQPGSQPSSSTCLYCGKVGHWKRDCRKFAYDKQHGQVRQIADDSGVTQTQNLPSLPPPPPALMGGQIASGVSASNVSTGSTPQQPVITYLQPASGQVRRFELAPQWTDDLTSIPISDGDLRMVSCISSSPNISNACDAVDGGCRDCCETPVFDMSYSDSDPCWTFAPDLSDHVRAVSLAEKVDIILDSGADGSVLPLHYGDVGKSVKPSEKLHFVDAQGASIDVANTRLACLDLEGISIKEEFIIASVTSPLVSLGRLLKHGWVLNTDDAGLHLSKGSKRIPVGFKRNSLCITGSIRMLQQVDDCIGHLRAVQLNDSLQRVKPTWTKLGAECFGIKTYRPECVDSTLAPSDSLMWYRTMLVKRNGSWDLYKHNQFITDAYIQGTITEPIDDPSSVQEVLTLCHPGPMTPAQLGFSVVESMLDLLDSGSSNTASASSQGVSGQAGHSPVSVALDPNSLPVADDEPAAVDMYADPEEIEVNGTRLNSASPHASLKAACTFLGIAGTGNRPQLFKRILQHLSKDGLLASHVVEQQLSTEMERVALSPNVPSSPTEAEMSEHCLTHIPFRDWCTLCIANKSRQDKHHREAHSSSTHSVISFDFGFSGRNVGDDDSITVLFLHDRATKMMHAVPTLSKGGASLPYLTSEVCRFVTWTGHQQVGLRCDNEPSTISLLDSVRRALKGLGIHTVVERTVPGNSEGNGAAEVTVQVVRNQANLLIQQVEAFCGVNDRAIFGANHPLYHWAMVHASFLHNRFAVSQGETPFERCAGKMYSGKLCYFGECVMGYLKPTAKGLPAWYRGVWLGKTFLNDANVVYCNNGLFITRSVRRIPNPWSLDALGKVEMTPQECAFATLGSRLYVPKRLTSPAGVASNALLPAMVAPQDVQTVPHTPDEAASEPPTPFLPVPALGLGSGLVTPLVPRGEAVSADASAEPASAAPVPMAPPPANAALAAPASPRGPRIVRDSQDGESGISASEPSSPSKRARVSRIADVDYEHEDDQNLTMFSDADVDQLEHYDQELQNEWEDWDTNDLELDDLMKQLIFPASQHEPTLSPERMAEIDAIAEQVETRRLIEMGVLLPIDSIDASKAKRLSTRFVTTWRSKTLNGEACWLRRARFVAREYSWLTPERQDLFSPASSSCTSKLLPSLYLYLLDKFPHQRFVLVSMDIGDAFLCVDQVDPVIVTCGGFSYALGRVLPGQRDGSQLWYEHVTRFLGDKLNFHDCKGYPCLLATPATNSDGADKWNNLAVLLLHVDDMLIVSEQQYFHDTLLPTVKSRHKTSVQVMETVGDFIEFLKRTHVLVEPGTIHIQHNPRHFDKLFEITGVKDSMHPKKTPCHDLMNQPDKTDELDPAKASLYRSAIGILMYLSSDLVECAYTIRGLAQYMSKPTQRSWMLLRHLCLYLISIRRNVLRLKVKPNGVWHSPETDQGPVLELFSDSDWATHKATRKSVSAGFAFFAGCLLLATSRTQRIISLSSAEAEVVAAVSTVCDGILLQMCLIFCLGYHVRMKLSLDNTAARHILQRSGVGRVRHLSCRLLWIQQHVKDRKLETASIPTKQNTSDLATKKLSKDRMEYLMYLVGVYDEFANELVGTEVHMREQQCEKVSQVLRLMIQGSGELPTHKSMVSAKRSLQFIMLMTMMTEADALSPGFPDERPYIPFMETVLLICAVILVFAARHIWHRLQEYLESWAERVRVLETQVQSLNTSLSAVRNALDRFPDPDAEPDGDRQMRYLRSPMEECSDPELWTRLHGLDVSSHDSDSSSAEGARETRVTVSDPVLYYSFISEQRSRQEGSQAASTAADIDRSLEELREARERAQEAIRERIQEASAVGNHAAVEFFQAQASRLDLF